jgi:hypothetical protein
MTDPLSKHVMTVPEAGRVLDLKPKAAYAAAKRGDIPTIKIGPRLIRVPVERFRREVLEKK